MTVAVSDVVATLHRPVLAAFLEERGEHLRDIAVDEILQAAGSRIIWNTGPVQQAVMSITFVGTLVTPLQFTFGCLSPRQSMDRAHPSAWEHVDT